MSFTTNKTILGLLTLVAAILALFQGILPSAPLEPEQIKIVGGVVLFAITAATIWKQYLSDVIANRAIKRTLIVAVIGTLVGLTDLFGYFHFSESAEKWVRFLFTLAIAVLNFLSQYWYPENSEL